MRAEGLSAATRPHRWADWRIVRALLLGVFVIAVAGTWFGGMKHATYSDLRGDVAAGRTHWVGVTGGLPDSAVGDAQVVLHWRAEGHRNYAEVTQSSTAEDRMSLGAGDIATQLQALAPRHDLTVERTGFTTGTEVAGWQPPGWVLPVVMVLWLATVVAVVNGPQPRYATRWAWFWMIATPVNVVGLPMFLAVSAPWRSARAVATRGPQWRLTGGKAFLITFLIGSVFGLAWQH